MIPQRPTLYVVAPHLEEYNIPLSAFAAARPQFHNIVASALIFSTTVPEEASPSSSSITASSCSTTATLLSASSSPATDSAPSSPSSTSTTSTSTPTSQTSTPATTPSQSPSHSPSTPPTPETTTALTPNHNSKYPKEPKTLLLQRSHTDPHPLSWENPSGVLDATRDATVLAGVARQVREETGFHVSRFVDLVCVDEWTKMKRGVLLQETKLTFLVEVREVCFSGWEGGVKLGPGYRGFSWVSEGEVLSLVRGVKRGKGGLRGELLKGFEVFNGIHCPGSGGCF